MSKSFLDPESSQVVMLRPGLPNACSPLPNAFEIFYGTFGTIEKGDRKATLMTGKTMRLRDRF